jgi:predicted dehydrogenase
VRLAVVGCGAVAEYFHLPAAARVLERDDLWLVDPDRERARDLAARFGRVAQVVPDHRDLPDVDAAIVAVPNHLHADVAVDLLERGIHVLVEKPLAISTREGRRVVEAARGRVLAVGNFRRLFPSTRLVAELVERKTCGRPIRFVAEEGFVYSWTTRSGFALDRARAGGGVLIDLGSHVLDQLLLCLGPLDVHAYRDDAYGGIEADCLAELTGPGGVAGTVELSRTRELGSTLRIECEGGTIEAPLAHAGSVRVTLSGEVDPTTHAPDAEWADGGYGAAFEAQLRAFLRAIEGTGTAEVGGTDGVRVLELIEACYERRAPLREPWVFDTLAS